MLNQLYDQAPGGDELEKSKGKLFYRTLSITILMSLALSLAIPLDQAVVPAAFAGAAQTGAAQAGTAQASAAPQPTQQPEAAQKDPVSEQPGKAEPAPQYILYKVKKGDTLYALARRYGTSINAIASASGIRPTAILGIGMLLKIPTTGVVQVSGGTATATGTVKTSAQAEVAPAEQQSQRPEPLASRGGGRGAVAVAWAEAQEIFARGAKAKITDVKTGLSFMVVRRGGWAHADVEPATRKDTAIMKQIWGSWNWSRRPVVVEIGGHRIAASMAGMPHGGEMITDNGVSGHVDLHFLNSTTHGSVYTRNRKPTLDPAHQRAVQEAIGK